MKGSEGMRFQPHDYQKYAIDYIVSHNEAAVLLDMGLGKTVITLSAIRELALERFDVKQVLVVAPLRVTQVWKNEVKKWDHLTGITISVAVGSAEERRGALWRDTIITVINRENVKWLVEDSGVPLNYDMLVIDELSSFKNHQSQRFKALMKLRLRIKRVVGLTGTPASNGLMDLWAEYKLIDQGKRLGQFIGKYRALYFRPDRTNGMIVYNYKPLTGAEEKIYSLIDDMTISMKALDHLNMPEYIENVVRVQMSDDEMQQYKHMKVEMVFADPNGELDATNAAALSNKLSQMANGALYGDMHQAIHIHDRKLDALEDLIEAANGKPVLIAYWFKHDYQRIRERFPAARDIRQPRDIEDWNAGRIPVACIHPASSGHGLNLQSGGSTLIWFGLTWSLELYQQTNGRLWRQGQTAKTVVVHHIVTEGTIDESIMVALQKKDKTQSALIDAVKAEIGG